MTNVTHLRPMTLDTLRAGKAATLDSFAHLRLWLSWRDEDGRKIPYRIDTLRPGWKDPAGRGTRDEARRAAKRLLSSGQGGGIAIVLGPPEKGARFVLCGQDLDTCLAPSGELAPFAQAEIAAFPTYAEISPSGTGIKRYFWVAAADMPTLLPALGTDGNGKQVYGRAWKRGGGNHAPGIELYLGGRWFAVTGQLLPGSSRELAVIPAEALLTLIEKRGPAFKGSGGSARRERASGGGGAARRGRGVSGRSERTIGTGGRIKRNGANKAFFEDWVDDDSEAAAWKADHDQRQVDRAWERSDYGSDLSDFEGFGFNEDGVAMMFAAGYQDKLRFDHTIGKWYRWNDSYWQRQDTQLAYDWVRGTCRKLRLANAASVGVEKMATTRFANGVERFARADNKAFAVTFEVWNRDAWLLGTPGGTVDLRTGELRPARQEDFISKVTAVTPNDPALVYPARWLKFLREATGNDAALLRFLQQWCGYCLSGDISEQALLFIFGPGGNGKTVFLNLITWILNDYVRTASMQTFMASQNDRHLTELARLEGARLVAAAETEQGRAWAETRIKQVTGGDTITANYMRQDQFEYRPQFKIIGIGNNKPRLTDIGPATRRRFNLVPFNYVPKVVNKNLETELRKEGCDILAWMIEGCLDWQSNGLCRPAVVVRATDEYFQEQDIVGRWLGERCEQDRRYKTLTTALYDDFKVYCMGVRERERSMTWFAEELSKRDFEKGRDTTTGLRLFNGLRLRSEDDDEL